MSAHAIGTRVRVIGSHGAPLHFLPVGKEGTVQDPHDPNVPGVPFPPGDLVTDQHVLVIVDDLPRFPQIVSAADVEVIA